MKKQAQNNPINNQNLSHTKNLINNKKIKSNMKLHTFSGIKKIPKIFLKLLSH